MRLSLRSCASLSLLSYCLIAAWFPLNSDLPRSPLPDIQTFTPSLWSGVAYGALLCVLFGLTWLAYQWVSRRERPPSPAVILLVAALFCLPLIFTFPINATDIYRYAIRGRVTSVYHESPFSVAADAHATDPYLPLAGEWAEATSPYGPIWELTAAGVTLISGENLSLALLLFKVLAATTHLAIGGLIWLMLRDAAPAERAARTLLWAWNPALLLIFVADGHNDGLMLFWLLLGVLLVRRDCPGRVALGLVVMALAPLTKPIGLLALPFFYIEILRRSPAIRTRISLLLRAGVGTLAVVSLAFAPFVLLGGGVLELVQRLFQEVSSSGGFSPAALSILIARRLGVRLALEEVVSVGVGLFILVALGLFWRTWRGRPAIRGTANLLGAYLVQAASFRIWYASWPLPWLLLDLKGARGRLTAGVWLLLTSQLSVLIHNHLRRLLFGGEHLVSHAIGVPFVLLVPLAAAWIERKRTGKAAKESGLV